MAEGRQRDAWDRTSEILSLLFNAHKAAGVSGTTSNEWHPLRTRREKEADVIPGDITVLKVFLPQDRERRIEV